MVKYVLSEFEDGEKERIFRAIEKASNGIKILLESDIDRAMNYINGDVVV
jgi:PTH1 family peptidyl-tRNA hydrolase